MLEKCLKTTVFRHWATGSFWPWTERRGNGGAWGSLVELRRWRSGLRETSADEPCGQSFGEGEVRQKKRPRYLHWLLLESSLGTVPPCLEQSSTDWNEERPGSCKESSSPSSQWVGACFSPNQSGKSSLATGPLRGDPAASCLHSRAELSPERGLVGPALRKQKIRAQGIQMISKWCYKKASSL